MLIQSVSLCVDSLCVPMNIDLLYIPESVDSAYNCEWIQPITVSGFSLDEC